MLSPVKAIIAGALAFAIGGAFLIAQPFEQPGASVPGAAADPSVSVVRGQYTWFGNGAPAEQLALDGMLERSRGTEQRGLLSMSDERLSGDVTFEYDIDRWATDEVDEGDVALFWGTALIENDGGTWEGTHLAADGQARDRPFVAPVVQLSGSGGYDGLSAVVYFTSDPLGLGLADSVDGLIFSGPLPPDR